MKTTNHLTSTTFYHDFLDWLVRLEPFHDDDITPPMSANQFYWMARMQFSTGSRISEKLYALKTDYDFDHRIFTIRNPKTNKGGVQKTTILPYDVKPFEKFCNRFSENERLFLRGVHCMNKCPRCNLNKLLDDNVMNSMSHTHNGVIICNDCGEQEALTLQGLGDIEDKIIQVRWENYKA